MAENEQLDIAFKMGIHEWTIPIEASTLHQSSLNLFVSDLNLQISDYVYVAVSTVLVAWVIVFDHDGMEKTYPWLS